MPDGRWELLVETTRQDAESAFRTDDLSPNQATKRQSYREMLRATALIPAIPLAAHRVPETA